MADEHFCLKWNNHASVFANAPNKLRQKEMYADVSLACAGKIFPVHKFVLATCSDYFHEVFSEVPCTHPVIFLKDLSEKELIRILDFMYTGQVSIPHSDLESLISTAKHLRVKGLAIPDEYSSDLLHANQLLEENFDTDDKRIREGEEDLSDIIRTSTPEINPKKRKRSSSKSEDSQKENNEFPEQMIEGHRLEHGEDFQNSTMENYDNQENGNEDKISREPITNGAFPNNENLLKEIKLEDVGERLNSSTPGNNSFTEPKKKPYECKICLQTFTRRDNLNNHMMTHTGEKPHQCKTCEKSFSRKDYLKQHERTHTGEKPYQCDLCDSAYTRKEGLDDHKRTHSGFQHLQCQLCGKTFKQKCSLRFHKRTQH